MNEDQEVAPRQRIVVSYTPAQEGRDIREEDVVRPLNHRWCMAAAETDTWRDRSNARCPTYGSCPRCVKSGPVGKLCNECGEAQGSPQYTVVKNGEKILDSITLAEMCHRTHETAKADRFYTPGMDRWERFNDDHLSIALHRIYRNVEDKERKERLIRAAHTNFYRLMEDNDEEYEEYRRELTIQMEN